MTTATDPITFAVLKSAFDSIVDDMAYTVMRTARSPIVRDVLDYSVTMCDAQGRILAQAKTVALHLGAVPDAMDIWRIRPAGGAPERVTQHDSRVTHPVFVDGRTLAYLAGDQDGSLHVQLARAYRGMGQREKGDALLARAGDLQRAADERAARAAQRTITPPK